MQTIRREDIEVELDATLANAQLGPVRVQGEAEHPEPEDDSPPSS